MESRNLVTHLYYVPYLQMFALFDGIVKFTFVSMPQKAPLCSITYHWRSCSIKELQEVAQVSSRQVVLGNLREEIQQKIVLILAAS